MKVSEVGCLLPTSALLVPSQIALGLLNSDSHVLHLRLNY